LFLKEHEDPSTHPGFAVAAPPIASQTNWT
jgi:hypothetical protein